MTALTILDQLPSGLLETDPRALLSVLGGPTLIRLPGDAEPPLFVSVLLHGNEVSGWIGVQRLLRQQTRLPRSVWLFIGNVAAAAQAVRSLPGQADFNRMWRNATHPVATAVLAAIAETQLFAVVDLHNNTGSNPHYAVVTDLAPGSLGLAKLFSDTAVYVEQPATVLTRAFEGKAPSVGLELGPVGDPRADHRAHGFLNQLLNLDRLPQAQPEQLALFRTLARVHVPEDVVFGFAAEADGEVELVLDGGIEASNFASLPAGTWFGRSRGNARLCVLDNDHREVTDDYFETRDGNLSARLPVIPAMYTTDPLVVRQDCLCYFMERLN